MIFVLHFLCIFNSFRNTINENNKKQEMCVSSIVPIWHTVIEFGDSLLAKEVRRCLMLFSN